MRETPNMNIVEYHESNLMAPSKNQCYRDNPQERQPKLTEEQLQVVFGSLLGDGTLIKTHNGYRLSFCHGRSQYEYLKFKIQALSNIFLAEPCRYNKGKYDQYHAHSTNQCSDLQQLKGLFYPNGKKKVTTKILKQLGPTALLIWHLDDGSVIRASGNAFVLCTDSFKIGEVQAIKKWLWKSHRIESFLLQSKGAYSDNIYWRLRFRKEGSIALNQIMKLSPLYNLIPESMKYKLPY